MSSYVPGPEILNNVMDDPPAPGAPSSPRNGLLVLSAVVFMLGLGVFVAIKAAGLYGYDLLAWLQPSPAALTMQQTSALPATGEIGPDATALDALDPGLATPVRDIPPEVTPDRPEFALRDGVSYGYITNLDSETLRRLDTVQEQLSEVVGYTDRMGQSVRQFAGVIVPRMRQVERQQQALTDALHRLMAQLDRIDASVQDIRVDLLRTRSPSDEPKPAPSGPPIQGWRIQTIQNGRAWLKSPAGTVVTVVQGERLQSLGAVAYVDSRQVVMEDGRFIR